MFRVGTRTFCVLAFTIVLNLLNFEGDGFELALLISEYPSFFTLLVYIFLFALSFFMFPVIMRLSAVPKGSPDFSSTAQSVNLRDVSFRQQESGKRRTLRYMLFLSYVFIHDFLLFPLGISGYSEVISPRSDRCELLTSEMNIGLPPARNSSLPLMIPLDTTDYSIVIFMSGEVAGVVGIIGFVLSLEFQYRYHQYLMDTAEFLELLRRN